MALNIRLAMKLHNTSINEVASRLGINRVSLSQQIHGNPTIETLNRIAAAIGCDVSELFDQKQDVITCPYCGREINVKLTRKDSTQAQ